MKEIYVQGREKTHSGKGDELLGVFVYVLYHLKCILNLHTCNISSQIADNNTLIKWAFDQSLGDNTHPTAMGGDNRPRAVPPSLGHTHGFIFTCECREEAQRREERTYHSAHPNFLLQTTAAFRGPRSWKSHYQTIWVISLWSLPHCTYQNFITVVS